MKLKLLLVTSIAALSCGCLTDGIFLSKTPVQVAPARTNIVQVLSTNILTETRYATNYVTITNAVTGAREIQPQVLPQIVLNPVVVTNEIVTVVPATYYTNVSLSGGAESGIRMAGNVAGAAGIPFASTASTILLGLSTVVFGFFNNRNAKKAKAAAEGLVLKENALDQAKTVAETLVDNIETIRNAAKTVPGYTEQMDKTVMKAVAFAQATAGAGVHSDIKAMVEKFTPTPSPI